MTTDLISALGEAGTEAVSRAIAARHPHDRAMLAYLLVRDLEVEASRSSEPEPPGKLRALQEVAAATRALATWYD